MKGNIMTGPRFLPGLFSKSERRHLVWEKGVVDPRRDRNIWRRDHTGALIMYSEYGNRASRYGWEIDHIIPVAVGGTDYLYNLRPLNCFSNASAGGLLGTVLTGRRH
ncbi:HNH endonuclease signature motif containing protein [Microbaculum marinum]|uniref:HNH endonuclease signature motif containing protein n=1 Tax=Microbaculum marinum TaxID=1764581 RepID=A0AAW9RLS3_9HYPH